MPCEEASTFEVAPKDLGEALSAVRLCSPQAQEEMQLSLARLGQLTPVQVYRTGKGLELFDGFKRVRAARELSWPAVRAEAHALDAAGAKVRLLRCNAGAGLSELEEAWLVRSLYREDELTQPQIAVLLGRHKSWVCRRLTLAEALSDGITASVRLGLLSATAVRELARLPRGNQDRAAQVVARRGLTTRQAARLVDALLATPAAEWDRLLEQAPLTAPPPKGGGSRRTPAEQLVADAWTMKRVAARLHARLLERSLASLGREAYATVSRELLDLRAALRALGETLDTRLGAPGVSDAP
jgi:ParB-like nuclease family protein/KorB-like protein with beta-barrel domain